jgi:hypothetical protein
MLKQAYISAFFDELEKIAQGDMPLTNPLGTTVAPPQRPPENPMAMLAKLRPPPKMPTFPPMDTSRSDPTDPETQTPMA